MVDDAVVGGWCCVVVAMEVGCGGQAYQTQRGVGVGSRAAVCVWWCVGDVHVHVHMGQPAG